MQELTQKQVENHGATPKQFNYALNLFSGMYQREAYLDAYKCTYALKTVDANASRLAHNEKVLAILADLKKAAEDASVANVLERKQRLTEILRADIPDFVTDEGIKVTKNSPNAGAVSEITTKKKIFRGGVPVEITNLKLHNPISAISELNKMEAIGIEKGDTNIQINIISAIPRPDDNSNSRSEITIHPD